MDMSEISNVHLQPSDDTVQCLFFSTELGSDRLMWEKLCLLLNNFIKTITEGYIWHRDEFTVYVPNKTENNDNDIPFHLCSVTCFGDNLEDEWFIVNLVLEISKKFKHLIIQLKDNDGDFLLIEAANHLQTWAKPENTDNRVFIYGHSIHIISPKLATLQSKLILKEALSIVSKTPELTKASEDIQEAILKRIGSYPEKMTETIHRARVNLPLDLAALLTLKPNLIAPIIDAYCNSDSIDAKLCKNIDFNDCVTVEVKFTKFLYAMLVHSKLINCIQSYAKNKKDKKTTLGVKLTCGYRIIMGKSLQNNESSREFQNFLNSLNRNGYFKNNIKGSTEYNHLLDKAQQYFVKEECSVSSKISSIILELMNSNDFTTVKDTLKCASIEHLTSVEDDEDWLNIRPENLNTLLHTRYGKQTNFKTNDIISSQAITQELTSFLKQTSDFEGIEPECQGTETPEEDAELNNIDFESDQFIACIEKMLNIISVGDSEDIEDVDSDDDLDNMYLNEEDDLDDDDCDLELKAKLKHDPAENMKDDKTVFENIIQSMKEEKASTGPSSNLMRCLGVSKTELLDSDDD